MAGHSHWAGIKHRKGTQDTRRGKLFSKMAKLIMTAARHGGADPDANLSLKYAIERARAVSMPRDSIDRAVAKGAGELDGENRLEAVTYEGYGPGGVAILIDGLTDNRNRTSSELRKLFDSHGGNMGQPGCVAWLFEKKGLLSILRGDSVNGEKVLEVALEADAEDVQEDSRYYEITCRPERFLQVRSALQQAGMATDVAEISSLPKSRTPVSAETAQKVLALIDGLEDHEDVQAVFSNAELPEETLRALETAQT